MCAMWPRSNQRTAYVEVLRAMFFCSVAEGEVARKSDASRAMVLLVPQVWTFLLGMPADQGVMKESDVVRAIMLDLGNEPDLRIFRNNTGALNDVTGRLVRYGLAPGSSDLIMVMLPYGRMVCFEAKTTDKRSKPNDEQIAWGTVIRQMGGYYEIVRSKEEARWHIEELRKNPLRKSTSEIA